MKKTKKILYFDFHKQGVRVQWDFKDLIKVAAKEAGITEEDLTDDICNVGIDTQAEK